MATKRKSPQTGEWFTFFWGGEFSQWYPSRFTAVVPVGDTTAELTFSCAEQYMMYRKAAMFGDWITAEKILATDDPRIQKKLGRGVKPFDPEKWRQEAKHLVYLGNLAKFTQNVELKKVLLFTAGSTLVEASPYDTIWGIGMDVNHADVTDRSKWKGTNWLGEVLTQLRNDLVKANQK